MTTAAWTTDPEIERVARRRAAARLGWIVHATVYLLVNGFMLAIASYTGRHGIGFGAVGWGFGLAIHGLVVLVSSSGLLDRMARAERARLLAQRDPW
jgi:hypothetical protein